MSNKFSSDAGMQKLFESFRRYTGKQQLNESVELKPGLKTYLMSVFKKYQYPKGCSESDLLDDTGRCDDSYPSSEMARAKERAQAGEKKQGEVAIKGVKQMLLDMGVEENAMEMFGGDVKTLRLKLSPSDSGKEALAKMQELSPKIIKAFEGKPILAGFSAQPRQSAYFEYEGPFLMNFKPGMTYVDFSYVGPNIVTFATSNQLDSGRTFIEWSQSQS